MFSTAQRALEEGDWRAVSEALRQARRAGRGWPLIEALVDSLSSDARQEKTSILWTIFAGGQPNESMVLITEEFGACHHYWFVEASEQEIERWWMNVEAGASEHGGSIFIHVGGPGWIGRTQRASSFEGRNLWQHLYRMRIFYHAHAHVDNDSDLQAPDGWVTLSHGNPDQENLFHSQSESRIHDLAVPLQDLLDEPPGDALTPSALADQLQHFSSGLHALLHHPGALIMPWGLHLHFAFEDSLESFDDINQQLIQWPDISTMAQLTLFFQRGQGPAPDWRSSYSHVKISPRYSTSASLSWMNPSTMNGKRLYSTTHH